MSRGSMAIAFALAAGMAWTSIAAAHGHPSGMALSPWTLEGRVVSVDSRNHTLTVDANGRETKLTVAPRATVVRDGLNVPFDEVKPFDEVRATFLAEDLTRTRPWKLELWSPGGREAR